MTTMAFGLGKPSPGQKLDTIQATALRIATGAYKGTQTFSLEVECNILPLQGVVGWCDSAR